MPYGKISPADIENLGVESLFFLLLVSQNYRVKTAALRISSPLGSLRFREGPSMGNKQIGINISFFSIG
jgi:hypothetical protein